MLAGQMSNQDEDEVEDELEALQREVAGVVEMPNVPSAALPELTAQEKEDRARERAKARAKERTAMLAA